MRINNILNWTIIALLIYLIICVIRYEPPKDMEFDCDTEQVTECFIVQVGLDTKVDCVGKHDYKKTIKKNI